MAISTRFFQKPIEKLTDEELAQMVSHGGKDAERALNCFYKRFGEMPRMAWAYHRAEKSLIMDAYHDALLALKTNLLAGKFEKRGQLRAFFAMTFRNKCIDIFRRGATIVLKPELENYLRREMSGTPESPEDAWNSDMDRQDEERKEALRKKCYEEATSAMTSREMDILTDYFVNDMSANELAEKHGYKTAAVARQTVSKLKTKLDESIEQLCQAKPECRILRART